MTREEKRKAIDALKKSVPVRAMTEEEFNDYIQTINKIMDWLEQEHYEDVISRKAVLDVTVKKNSIWNSITNSKGENLEEIISQLPPVTPQSCNDVLDKIRAEIKAMSGDIETIADVLQIIDKYKAESEDKE